MSPSPPSPRGGRGTEETILIFCVPWFRQLGNTDYGSNVVKEMRKRQKGKMVSEVGRKPGEEQRKLMVPMR